MKTVSMPLDEFTKEVNTAHQLGKEEGFKRAFDLLLDVVLYKRMPAIGEQISGPHKALIVALYENGDVLRKTIKLIVENSV